MIALVIVTMEEVISVVPVEQSKYLELQPYPKNLNAFLKNKEIPLAYSNIMSTN